MAESVTSLPNDQQKCVACDKQRPADGKLLHCLHIVCASCLRDILTSKGNVQCTLCKEITSPTIGAVALARQLAEARPLLYPKSTQVAASCDFCEAFPKKATHSCADCGDAVLCEQHAAKHVTLRPFRSHSVQPLSQSAGQQPGGRHGSDKCLVHVSRSLTQFCSTCCHAVCCQCLLNGHADHALMDLAEAAEEQRLALRQVLESRAANQRSAGSMGGSRYAASSNLSLADCFEPALKAVTDDLLTVQKESVNASEIITAAFNEVQKLLEQEKAKLLARMEEIKWQASKPLEMQQQRLQVLHNADDSALELSKALLAEDVPEVDVMTLGRLAVPKLQGAWSDIEAVRSGSRSARIQANVNAQVMQSAERDIQNLIYVQYTPHCDPINQDVNVQRGYGGRRGGGLIQAARVHAHQKHWRGRKASRFSD